MVACQAALASQFEFRSGLVDLVVCIRHHRGGGHLRTLLCELVICLITQNLPQTRNRGCQLWEPCPGEGTGREARDDGGAFRAPEPVEARREACERNSDDGGVAGVVVVANRQLEVFERRERVTVLSLEATEDIREMGLVVANAAVVGHRQPAL